MAVECRRSLIVVAFVIGWTSCHVNLCIQDETPHWHVLYHFTEPKALKPEEPSPQEPLRLEEGRVHATAVIHYFHLNFIFVTPQHFLSYWQFFFSGSTSLAGWKLSFWKEERCVLMDDQYECPSPSLLSCLLSPGMLSRSWYEKEAADDQVICGWCTFKSHYVSVILKTVAIFV